MKSKPNKTPRNQSVAVAACSFALAANGEVQLLPAGEFHARDGRPAECAAWLTNADIAAAIIAGIAALSNPVVIDYEHQTILSAENGKPAPAAGWFTAADMEWREGDARITSDTAWFLLDTTKPIKPFIYQERKAPVFVEQTDPQADDVFSRKKFKYGAEARAAGGYGFWQLCFGSTGA